jgi:galactonate dehydratase
MKITDIRCHLMQAGPPSHTGWTASGTSALAGSRNWCFVTLYTDAGLVGTGEGSDDIERITQKLRVAMMGHGQSGVVGTGAIAAIDIALWDLKAQRLGTSVVDLLGGQTRSRVPYYTHAANVETALAAVAPGVTAVKVGGIANIVERAWAIREAIGPKIGYLLPRIQVCATPPSPPVAGMREPRTRPSTRRRADSARSY